MQTLTSTEKISIKKHVRAQYVYTRLLRGRQAKPASGDFWRTRRIVGACTEHLTFYVLTSRQPPGVQFSGSRHNEIRPFVLPYRVTRRRTRDTFVIFIRCEATGERFLGRGYWQTVATFRGHIYVFTVD